MLLALHGTTTRNTTYKVISTQPINKISTREYDLDIYFELESSLYAAAMKVPSKRAGGEHGNVYLLMN